MSNDVVPGIEDLPRLGRWLHDNGILASADPPEVRLIAGGRSNLTYLLDPRAAHGPGAPRLVLRRPPLGHVLPTAHDMNREYRVLSALRETAIPVPWVVALCADPSVIGAPFYLMRHVPGHVLRHRADAALLTPAQAALLSEQFADMLAAIHGLDPASVGLAGFGRPEGYLQRQLARWRKQWDLSVTRDMPGFEQLAERLAAGLPEQSDRPGSLVHGDYRLDNMLVTLGDRPAIAAVVDWEMSTLGDPLADLGLSLVYWAEPGDDLNQLSVSADITASPGFFNRSQVAERYAAVTGRDVSALGYYMAFGCFKLAVVLEGIHARYLQGKTVGEGFEKDGLGVPLLVQRAHRLLDSVG
jgi:aminoglycoside phosphotransferase (APT) family kinase protein